MIRTIQPDWNAPPGVHACCTTRLGGLSNAPFEQLNLALHVGDDDDKVNRNRELLRHQLQLPAVPEWINQTHGTHTVILEEDITRDADAAITRMPGKVAVVMTADCLPILLCNRDGTEVGAVHAGWRGLERGVVQQALATMQSSNELLKAWIGPGISQACFEVGDEVREAFEDSVPKSRDYFSSHREGHWLCDLAGIAEMILHSQGVGEVYRDSYCTFQDAERFFSYRRDSVTGRMASLIWIK